MIIILGGKSQVSEKIPKWKEYIHWEGDIMLLPKGSDVSGEDIVLVLKVAMT